MNRALCVLILVSVLAMGCASANRVPSSAPESERTLCETSENGNRVKIVVPLIQNYFGVLPVRRASEKSGTLPQLTVNSDEHDSRRCDECDQLLEDHSMQCSHNRFREVAIRKPVTDNESSLSGSVVSPPSNVENLKSGLRPKWIAAMDVLKGPVSQLRQTVTDFNSDGFERFGDDWIAILVLASIILIVVAIALYRSLRLVPGILRSWLASARVRARRIPEGFATWQRERQLQDVANAWAQSFGQTEQATIAPVVDQPPVVRETPGLI